MKKIILLVTILTISLMCIGCSERQDINNPDFGGYTGIYKLKNIKIKIYHNNDRIYYKVLKKDEFYGNGDSEIESNKVEINEYNFEFLDKALKVKSKNKKIASGTYQKDLYSTDDIYEDYVGDINYYDNKYNGEFQKNEQIINTVQTKDDEIRLVFNTDIEGVNIILNKKKDNLFSNEMFDKKYTIKYNGNFLKLSLSDDESELSGEYKKKEKLSKDEIIKLFID